MANAIRCEFESSACSFQAAERWGLLGLLVAGLIIVAVTLTQPGTTSAGDGLASDRVEVSSTLLSE